MSATTPTPRQQRKGTATIQDPGNRWALQAPDEPDPADLVGEDRIIRLLNKMDSAAVDPESSLINPSLGYEPPQLTPPGGKPAPHVIFSGKVSLLGSRRYHITTQSIHVEEGRLFPEHYDVDLCDVRELRFSSFLGSFASIEVFTRDPTTPAVVLSGLPDPLQVFHALQDALRTAKSYAGSPLAMFGPAPRPYDPDGATSSLFGAHYDDDEDVRLSSLS